MLGILRAAGDSPGYKTLAGLLWPEEDGGAEDSPTLSPGGAARAPVRPAPRLSRAAFVPPALSTPQPQRPRPASVAAGNRAAQRAGSSAFPELPPREAPAAFPRIRRAPGRAAWPGLKPELEGCRGLLRQFASAWTPRRPLSSAKESLLNTDIIQNRNFILFFLFCFSECEQQGM